ncbi:hypothetical protein N7450_011647 [Penicillium hetheringtonii]|uniref:Uncharacterized protein n=1 Tax=Penicillium hetheringtonii TaxID=911720 RepID=A0AAD6DAL9_9EURO|nr:hypothetical protein N7450_011647 [Penicillium hetheringtonii]
MRQLIYTQEQEQLLLEKTAVGADQHPPMRSAVGTDPASGQLRYSCTKSKGTGEGVVIRLGQGVLRQHLLCGAIWVASVDAASEGTVVS